MIEYEEAKSIAISKTIPDGKVFYSADAGLFYIFIIVPRDFPFEAKGVMLGSTFIAVDKSDGKVWTCSVTDPRLKGVKKIE